HIDVAWLWPLRETVRKCSRTFATALRYMQKYPEYRFGQSQPQLYAFTREHYPALYQRIKEAVQAGRWEPVGAMWVEADCNIPSGESLVRQVLHGKRFFMEEFGVETEILYLPDVFGYSAALPQILKKSRVHYFMTQKISWNQFNKFPHHTFWWEGLDGTRIFSHFLPADTYNGVFTPEELRRAERNFRDSDRASSWLYLFGYGDGGGGPTAEMLEAAKRVKDLDGVPRVEQEFARDFFRRAAAEAKDLPVWVGELYLELHRGTYTTQAHNKRMNRRCEFLLRDAEFLSAIRPGGLSGYPREALDRCWKLVLLNQFHDVIPGSSIGWVYEDSRRQYDEVARTGHSIVEDALKALSASIDAAGLSHPVVVWNTLSRPGREVVSYPLEEHAPGSVVSARGERWPVQVVEGEDGRRALFVAEVPPCGYAVYDLSSAEAGGSEFDSVTVGDGYLENGVLRVEWDGRGLLTRVFDKRCGREVLAAGAAANLFQLFDDRPNNWDAWDVDVFYAETGRDLTEVAGIRIVERGPVRGAVEFCRHFGNSSIRQVMRLSSGSARLDFVTEVEWHESNALLKVAFPVAINASRATYEIQYGHVERPTHINTSWDMARFEVVGHKWADLSEGDYGVALLNDCKYGYDVRGNVLRLSLLRAPKNPDPNADMGRHLFTYALYPHPGDVRLGAVVAEG
ncbi:MAG: glycoside hydrolase family 38 C-terminal domain-containing protein, partial [Armatimonadota bacterium]|nr:glycoside hydrolase family 38 C-terminal domain-containing protein [Armatimonadota bacterium]